jgi:phage gp29-like protein
MVEGEALPERKFIVHSVGGKDGSPFGQGVGSRLFWPVFFKRKGIGFWLIFADKFGSPTSVGKYPAGASLADQQKLLDALDAIAQDAGVIVPEGMRIELLEAKRSGSIDTYEKLARYMDEQITLAVLGETMTTIAQAAGLGSGLADVHNDVRKELAQADADLLSDTLNATLVKWIVDYNVPGAAYPKVWRSFKETIDLNARADRDTKIKGLGFEPDQNYITETYGPGWKKRAAPSPAAPLGGLASQTAFAESLRREAREAEIQFLAREAYARTRRRKETLRQLSDQRGTVDFD